MADSETVCSVPFIEDMVTYFCDKGHILPLSQIQTEEEWLQCAADAGYEETQVAVSIPNEQMEPIDDLVSQPKKLESQNETSNTGPKKPSKPQKKSKLEKKLEKLALEKQKEVKEAEKGLD